MTTNYAGQTCFKCHKEIKKDQATDVVELVAGELRAPTDEDRASKALVAEVEGETVHVLDPDTEEAKAVLKLASSVRPLIVIEKAPKHEACK